MKIDTILFDLDGTLLDTLEDLKNSVNAALASKGYPLRTLEEVRQFIGNGIKKLVERAAPKEISPEDYEELLDAFRKDYHSHCALHTKPFDGIMPLLLDLKKQGYHLGVISNKAHKESVLLTEKFFKGLFPFVLGGFEDMPRKPHPAGLEKAMDYFGVTSATTLYIGDSDVDVATAHNAKMKCIGVSWGFRGRCVLTEAEADRIVDTPKEIISAVEAYSE